MPGLHNMLFYRHSLTKACSVFKQFSCNLLQVHLNGLLARLFVFFKGSQEAEYSGIHLL